MYYVYVLQSEQDNKFYKEHNSGISNSTKGRIPLRLVYYEYCLDHRDALKRERYLKTTWGKRYIKNRIKNYLEETKRCT